MHAYLSGSAFGRVVLHLACALRDHKYRWHWLGIRRELEGSTLTTGTKTPEPVDFDKATRIFTKLANEKKAKGYNEGPDGTPCQHTEKENRATGILPQLLNPIEESGVQRFLEDPRYGAQEKYDGRRILILKDGAEIHGINRKGLIVGLPETVFGATRSIPGDFVLDGECVGDVYYAFDMLQGPGFDLRAKAYQQRLVALLNLMRLSMQKHIRCAETAFAPGQKTGPVQLAPA